MNTPEKYLKATKVTKRKNSFSKGINDDKTS
jgi:hypothetical protein